MLRLYRSECAPRGLCQRAILAFGEFKRELPGCFVLSFCDHYNELFVRLVPAGDSSYRLDLTFRCYDAGVAFRVTAQGGQALHIERKKASSSP